MNNICKTQICRLKAQFIRTQTKQNTILIFYILEKYKHGGTVEARVNQYGGETILWLPKSTLGETDENVNARTLRHDV